MSEPLQHQPSLLERLERALVLLAYFNERDGDFYVPFFEKFEAELGSSSSRRVRMTAPAACWSLIVALAS
jgi:hypothetical protein